MLFIYLASCVVLLCVFMFCVPCYLCLFAHSDVQHILYCVFVFVFLSLEYTMLPVSLDWPYLIAPSVFSNVYLLRTRKLIVSPKVSLSNFSDLFTLM